MKKFVSRTGMLIFIMATMSCASQKKFDFANAYKFSHIENSKVTNVNEKVEVKHHEDPELRGSIDKLSPKNPNLVPGGVGPEVSIEEHIDIASNTEAIRSAYKNLTKAERKDVRKALKQTIRDIRTEKINKSELMTSLNDLESVQSEEPMQDEKKKRIAKYLLIGGGALVILAIIIGSVPVLTTIGIVAVVVGAVLMILSLNK